MAQKVFTPDPAEEVKESKIIKKEADIQQYYGLGGLIGSLKQAHLKIKREGKFIKKIENLVSEHTRTITRMSGFFRQINKRIDILTSSVKELQNLTESYDIEYIYKSLKQLNAKSCALANIAKINKSTSLVSALFSETADTYIDRVTCEISADELNAAAAGEFIVPSVFSVYTKDDEIVDILTNLAPDVVFNKTVSNGNIQDPTPEAVPGIGGGTCLMNVVFDTDAGATKVYVPGDEIVMVCDLNIFTWNLTQRTTTYIVV